MLFELASPFITLDIQDEIKMTIENHEPRVSLEDVAVTVLDNHLRIIIKYRILSIGQQDQVDFYLERIK